MTPALFVSGEGDGEDLAGSDALPPEVLQFFPRGFYDPKYLDWERTYKWEAHERWEEELGRTTFRALLREREFSEAASRAVRVEGGTHLLFSFEKRAMRDAIKRDLKDLRPRDMIDIQSFLWVQGSEEYEE